MLSDKERRKELGDFLKTRRARLSPQDFGLPIGRAEKQKDCAEKKQLSWQE